MRRVPKSLCPPIGDSGDLAGPRVAAPGTKSAVVYLLGLTDGARQILEHLVGGEHLVARTFDSALAFLDCSDPRGPSVAVITASYCDFEPFELQAQLATQRPEMAIIFISDHGDVAMSVRAMKAGAFDFLSGPLNFAVLLSAIRQAIAQSHTEFCRHCELEAMRSCYKSLSLREREVMVHVVSGFLNKQVARILGIAEITVKQHRGQVMRKMKARSFAALVKQAERLGISNESVLAQATPA